MVSDFEKTLKRIPVHKKIIHLRLNEPENLAVICYQKKAKKRLAVTAYMLCPMGNDFFSDTYIGEDYVRDIKEVRRTFRKSQKKIAEWYFHELWTILKNGIYAYKGKVHPLRETRKDEHRFDCR